MWCPCPTQSSPVPRGGFRREAVELVRSSGRPVKEIARDLGVSRQSLHTWVKRADIDVGRAPGLTTEDREELRKLRRENRILGEEREILKKWTWLPGVVAAVEGRCEVLFDSGIRSGSDALKALALGARAVLLGRPYIWGMALGGAQGVVEVLRSFLADLDLAMALSGYAAIDEVGPEALVEQRR